MRKWFTEKGEEGTTSKKPLIPAFQMVRADCMNNINSYQKMLNRKFNSNDLSPKNIRRRGKKSLKFGHQKVFSSIQTKMYLLQNNTETWRCPWNWEKWVLTWIYEMFFTWFVIETGTRPIVKDGNIIEKVSICIASIFQECIL